MSDDVRERAIKAAWVYSSKSPEPNLSDAIATYESALWQPIETAPENDSMVLLAGRDGKIRMSRYRNGSFKDLASPDHHGAYSLDKNCFTHWRHLPAPPKDASHD